MRALLPVLSLALLLSGKAFCDVDPANQAAAELVARVVPDRAADFRTEIIPAAENGEDVFEVESRDDKIVLRGNNGVSVASALNWYLKQSGASISWNAGDQLDLPDPLPAVPAKVRVVSPHKYRFVYNFCTHGYTMAWWDWPQWQRELDYLALNGVNLALVLAGQEMTWIETFKAFGYPSGLIRTWVTDPAHLPWFQMDNMENYGSPLSESLVNRRLELGQRIVARMRALGMEPVLPGYYGMVPPDFKVRFPSAQVAAQGNWLNLKRPDILNPNDASFPPVAAAYYDAQRRLFGNVKFYAADPFHEGGKTDGIDIPAAGHAILDAMDGATWVLQSWQNNPNQAMLAPLEKSRLLILDLFCEEQENWRTRNAFDGAPWIWCALNNFGGNTGLNGRLAWMGEGPVRALQDPGKGAMSGIGAVPEGSQTNPVLWEYLFENTWRSESPNFSEWLSAYARRRYGAKIPEAEQAWSILADTILNGPTRGHYPLNSVVCARPSLDPKQRAREMTKTFVPYNARRLLQAWQLLLAAAPAAQSSDGYRYDVCDVGRQVLADLGTHYHRQIVAAYEARDASALRQWSDKMLGLIRDLDTLVGTRREFLLGPWLANAREWGSTKVEKDRMESNARELLTVWTTKDNVTDYANRQWSGLIGKFYYQRWNLWLTALNDALAQGTAVSVSAERAKIRAWEIQWTKQRDVFPTEPQGDTIAVAEQLYAKYGPEILNTITNPTSRLAGVKAEDFLGRWRYSAQGATWEREFLADGTALLYRGGVLQGWVGYTWAYEDGALYLKEPNGAVFEQHVLEDRDTLLFSAETFSPAKRVAASGPVLESSAPSATPEAAPPPTSEPPVAPTPEPTLPPANFPAVTPTPWPTAIPAAESTDSPAVTPPSLPDSPTQFSRKIQVRRMGKKWTVVTGVVGDRDGIRKVTATVEGKRPPLRRRAEGNWKIRFDVRKSPAKISVVVVDRRGFRRVKIYSADLP